MLSQLRLSAALRRTQSGHVELSALLLGGYHRAYKNRTVFVKYSNCLTKKSTRNKIGPHGEGQEVRLTMAEGKAF